MEATIYRSASQINSAMARVYGHMMLAVITSMVVAGWIGGSADAMAFLFSGIMKWVVIFSPLVAIFFITVALNADPPRHIALAMLHGFAALMGLSMSTIFVVYTAGSIASAFMGTAVLFGTLSAYGYFTKKDLSEFGQLLFVGLIAIVIASIINIFIGSTVMQMVISAVAILIFLGLTAYDTQKIREELTFEHDTAAEVRGALTLYLDFINLFLNLLQLFGSRKE